MKMRDEGERRVGKLNEMRHRKKGCLDLFDRTLRSRGTGRAKRRRAWVAAKEIAELSLIHTVREVATTRADGSSVLSTNRYDAAMVEASRRASEAPLPSDLTLNVNSQSLRRPCTHRASFASRMASIHCFRTSLISFCKLAAVARREKWKASSESPDKETRYSSAGWARAMQVVSATPWAEVEMGKGLRL